MLQAENYDRGDTYAGGETITLNETGTYDVKFITDEYRTSGAFRLEPTVEP